METWCPQSVGVPVDDRDPVRPSTGEIRRTLARGAHTDLPPWRSMASRWQRSTMIRASAPTRTHLSSTRRCGSSVTDDLPQYPARIPGP